jgi:methylated-DNA-[protein]-cysteine S-methyltransferase
MKVSYTALDLPTGAAFAAATPDGLTRLELKARSLSDFVRGLEAEFGVAPVEDGRPFAALRAELESYFAGEPVVFTPGLDLKGTEFQKRVWRALMKIPYGNVRSYRWVAAMLGNPAAARAVGGALNRNRVPIIIPCHRVVESSGGLGGFACGLDVKRALLKVEGILPPYGISSP